MICPKCGKENVTISQVSNVKTKRKGILYWLLVGWWWEPLWWLFFTVPAVIVAIFTSKKTYTKIETHCVCQNCGYSWKIK